MPTPSAAATGTPLQVRTHPKPPDPTQPDRGFGLQLTRREGVDPAAAVAWAEEQAAGGGIEAVRQQPTGVAPDHGRAGTASQDSTPPGWYQPEGEGGRWRWWDGQQWTDRTAAATPTPDPPSGPPAQVRPDPVPAGRELAGRGERLVALIIDWLVIVVPTVPFYLLSDAILLENPGSELAGQLAAVGTVTFWVLWVVLWVAAAGRTGRTYGKAVLGLEAVRQGTGEPLSAGLMAWRQLLRFFGSLSLLDGLFILSKERRTLHDLLSGSVVVTADKQLSPSDFVIGVLAGRKPSS